MSFWDWLEFGPRLGEVKAQASESASMGSSPDGEKTGYSGQPGWMLCSVSLQMVCQWRGEPVIWGLRPYHCSAVWHPLLLLAAACDHRTASRV